MAQQHLDHDELLASLLAQAADEQRRGQRPDVDALTRDHPELAVELRQLLGIVEVMDLAGCSAQTVHLPPAAAESQGVLPRAFGDYELIDELGRGGMGVVYKARERSLDRLVAVKMILRGEHASNVDLARFRAEAQAAAALTHPNIVPIFKVDAQDGQAFFSMMYVEGQTLAERLKSGPLRPRDAARYLAAVSRAVHHAHTRGILHRDLKPANVLIDSADQPLVSDFGLAKRVEGDASLTGTGAIIGTPSYMSPEQAAGQQGRIGPATDVYSLGAILYESLTGRPPFLADSAVATLMLVRTEEPVRPRLLNPQIDPDLEFICRKCLEKSPEHRYPSALALAEDLEAFLRDEPVSARSSSLAYFVNRIFRESHHAPVQENWGVLWMWHSLTLFLLCVVTAGIYSLGERRHWTYLVLWTVGLLAWGTFFWQWRRRAGPVPFVERQLAHAWAGGVTASIALFVLELLLKRDTLELSPLLGIFSGMVFLFKAGTLSGWFYVAAVLSFAATVPMAFLPPTESLPLFGLVTAIGFFVPGFKYYRQRRRERRSGPQ